MKMTTPLITIKKNPGRILGTFFDPLRLQLLTVGLGLLTTAETTNLSEPYLANSMIR